MEYEDESLWVGTAQDLRQRRYRFSWESGLEFKKARTWQLIANFRPVLVREITVYGEDEEDPQRLKEVRLERTEDDTITVFFQKEDLEGVRELHRKLGPLLPALYRVYEGGWGHLLPALSEFAEHSTYERSTRFAVMGWIKDYTAFVLPAMPFAITADGIDPTIMMSDLAVQELMHPPMKAYGSGVRLSENDEERLASDAQLVALLDLHPLAGLILTQVFAGPLSPFGVRDTPPFLHIQGIKTSFKTPLVLLCHSLFGSVDVGLETWASTQNVLQGRLHDARHVTLFVDDYKRSLVSADPVLVVQNYYDGTGRTRMGPDQTYRASFTPRGLIISAGEDTWESSGSMDARTLTVEAVRPVGEKALSWLEGFARVRARRDLLPLVGGAWLQWLAMRGQEKLCGVFQGQKALHASRITAARPDIDMKMVATVSTLLAVAAIVNQFLRERFPKAGTIYAERVNKGFDHLIETAAERTESAALLDPFNWMITAIQQAVNSDTAYFLSRHSTSAPSIGGRGKTSECIGWYDETSVFLTNERTFAWLLREAKRDGRTIPFSWRAFVQGAKESLGPFEIKGKNRRGGYQISVSTGVVRSVVIPRAYFDNLQEPAPLDLGEADTFVFYPAEDEWELPPL